MMKRLVTAIFIAYSALNAQAQGYLIEGYATGIDGQKVYIGDVKSRKDVIMTDSATVENGRFRLEGRLPAVKKMTLFVGKARKMFLLDEVPLRADYAEEAKEIKGKQVSVPVLKLSGDKDQELLETMDDALTQEMMGMLLISVMGKGKDVNAPENKALADSIATVYATVKANTKNVLDSITSNHADSYVSAMIMQSFYCKERPAEEVMRLYGGLSPRVRNSNVGRELKAALDAKMAIGVGREAPDFALKTPEGKELRLSSLRGKVVLLDFWASWCGPCIKEAPNVKRVYEVYKDKGFEVLSVSLDDDKDKWTQAISKHNLGWLHVSSLKGWQCPVAKLYQVSAVPAMFLLDRQGRIASVNARGDALAREVSKLCE